MPQYKFGETSTARLLTLTPPLQRLCTQMLGYMDITILCGHRDPKSQEEAFKSGASKLQWPDSKHNSEPSMAVDIAPYDPSAPGGVDWNDHARFGYMAGMMRVLAKRASYRIRWGGDWDGDGEVKDHTFRDLPHFEFLGFEGEH